ncbi:GNAT family acetyltransferase [Novosphingobium clariflavum]|uniref:GNAT family acetyltransferase n=1 Tax=Novosphingobium clariflavum TaxID=2029884 RepID=A0ABV6S9N1_9SPHN|nr:GNAT family acetyltransferase [Novosphingobium clariflavum]
MAVQIVVAEAADREDVVALWQAVGLTRPWNDPRADFELACGGGASRGGHSVILLAREEGGVVGTAMVGFDGHRGWVYYLGVREERRGTGIARMLMGAGEDWLVAQGSPKIQLMVRGDNEAALGFYAALGYARQDVVTLGKRLDA